jgi:hypothetical protein
MKNILEIKNLTFPISVEKNRVSDSFNVRYGKQLAPGLSRSAAAIELGRCIFHALECDGKLDLPEIPG